MGAPVAQLDRASGYEPEGREFESLRARHSTFREVETIFERDAWFRWRYNIRLQAGQSEYWLRHDDLQQAEENAKRLFDAATHHGARKYISVAHNLLAQVAGTRGDAMVAESELKTSLNLLRDYPAPLALWKTHAALARLHASAGRAEAAREAFAQAAAVAEQIAWSVGDEKLRTIFLNSARIREVFAGAQRSASGA